MKSPATKTAALQMIRGGGYLCEVARAHGVSVTSIRKWCRDAGVPFKLQTRGSPKGPRIPVGIRKMAADIVAGGASVAEASKRMDVCVHSVYKSCREFGVQWVDGRKGKPAANRRIVWDNVDWEKSDKELARELNVTRQRVNQRRRVYHVQCADPPIGSPGRI